MAKAKNKEEEQAKPPAPADFQDPPVDSPADPAAPVDEPAVDVAPPVDPAPPVDEDPPVDKPDPHAGLAPLLAPEDVTGCSFDGHEYQVEDDGLVYVPAEAVAALLDHGFEPFTD